MAEKELRKMNRTELIEIIYALQQNDRELRQEMEEMRRELQDRTIRKENAGSIAEAALSLNHIFEDAEAAAGQYLESLKAACAGREKDDHAAEQPEQVRQEKDDYAEEQQEQVRQECERLREETRQECERLRKETQQECERLREETWQECEDLRAQALLQAKDNIDYLKKGFETEGDGI